MVPATTESLQQTEKESAPGHEASPDPTVTPESLVPPEASVTTEIATKDQVDKTPASEKTSEPLTTEAITEDVVPARIAARHHPLLEGLPLGSFVSYKDNPTTLLSAWDWSQCCNQDLELPSLGTQWQTTQPLDDKQAAMQNQGQGLNQWYLRNGEKNNPTQMTLNDGLQVASTDNTEVALPVPALLLGSGLLLMGSWIRRRKGQFR